MMFRLLGVCLLSFLIVGVSLAGRADVDAASGKQGSSIVVELDEEVWGCEAVAPTDPCRLLASLHIVSLPTRDDSVHLRANLQNAFILSSDGSKLASVTGVQSCSSSIPTDPCEEWDLAFSVQPIGGDRCIPTDPCDEALFIRVTPTYNALGVLNGADIQGVAFNLIDLS